MPGLHPISGAPISSFLDEMEPTLGATLAATLDDATLVATIGGPSISARLSRTLEPATLSAKAVIRALRPTALAATATLKIAAQLNVTLADATLFARSQLAPTVLDYPSFAQWDGTKRVGRPGLRRRKASNGAIRPRATSSYARYDPILVHRRLTLAEFEELKNFETLTRDVDYFNVNYQPEGVTLKCIFADPPFRVDRIKGAPPVVFIDMSSLLLQVSA